MTINVIFSLIPGVMESKGLNKIEVTGSMDLIPLEERHKSTVILRRYLTTQ